MNCLFKLHKARPVAHAIGALAFASNIAGSDAPAVACATVYPFTTLLRILSAEIPALVLFR